MQNIDGLLELGHVEDAILTLRMDSNLDHSSAHERDRLPIGRRTSCLNQAQLITDFATCFLREPTQALTTVSEPLDRFRHSFRSPTIIQCFYNRSDARRQRAPTVPARPFEANHLSSNAQWCGRSETTSPLRPATVWSPNRCRRKNRCALAL